MIRKPQNPHKSRQIQSRRVSSRPSNRPSSREADKAPKAHKTPRGYRGTGSDLLAFAANNPKPVRSQPRNLSGAAQRDPFDGIFALLLHPKEPSP